MTALKPCPNPECGGTLRREWDGDKAAISCMLCGLRGPWYRIGGVQDEENSAGGAGKLWNALPRRSDAAEDRAKARAWDRWWTVDDATGWSPGAVGRSEESALGILAEERAKEGLE